MLLDGDWNLFKERIYKRNRAVEIENFDKNETYFKRLLELYTSYMINVCKDFGIDYIVLDAANTVEQNVKSVQEKLKSLADEQQGK